VAIEIPHLRSLQVAHGLVVSAEISTILGEARPKKPSSTSQKNPKKNLRHTLKDARGSSHGNHPVRPPYGTNSRGFVAQQAPSGAIHPHPIRLGNFDGRGGNSVREHASRLGGETHPPGAVPGTGDTVRICKVQL